MEEPLDLFSILESVDLKKTVKKEEETNTNGKLCID
jgi:hypothetical protein